MIELLGSIIGFAFDIVGMVFSIVFNVIGMVFGLLGGVLSLVFTVGWIALVGAIILTFFRRRRNYTRKTAFVDDNGEEFVSYYHQEG